MADLPVSIRSSLMLNSLHEALLKLEKERLLPGASLLCVCVCIVVVVPVGTKNNTC